MSAGSGKKYALIGAGSLGIGFACATSLSKNGFDVIITGRREEVLSKAAYDIKIETGANVSFISADQSTKEGTERIIDKVNSIFGSLDVFVSNTGGPKPGSFDELSESDFINAHEQLLLYHIRICKGILPLLKKSNRGRIINVLSTVVKEPKPFLTLSGVYRSGILNLSKTMAHELAPYGITVNNICPSAVLTDRVRVLSEKQSEHTGRPIELIYKEAVDKIPMKRFQKAQDLGDLCAYLASDSAADITGQTFTIDGGASHSIF